MARVKSGGPGNNSLKSPSVAVLKRVKRLLDTESGIAYRRDGKLQKSTS
jgi:hypothetical protein